MWCVNKKASPHNTATTYMAVGLVAALICSICVYSDETPSTKVTLTKLRNRVVGEAIETVVGGWDRPVGRSALTVASKLLLAPAASIITRQVRKIDVRPGDVLEGDPISNIRLSDGPFASTVDANVTRVRIEGFDSLADFQPRLVASGSDLVEAVSTLHSLDARVWLDTRLSGPLGVRLSQPLLVAATLSNVSLCLRWRVVLRKGALSAALSGAALSRSSLVVALDEVRVHIQDEVLVRIEAMPSDTDADAAPAASPLWRAFSKAFASLLKETVEAKAATTIEEALRAALITATRSPARTRAPPLSPKVRPPLPAQAPSARPARFASRAALTCCR